jgi:hypothetical protein
MKGERERENGEGRRHGRGRGRGRKEGTVTSSAASFFLSSFMRMNSWNTLAPPPSSKTGSSSFSGAFSTFSGASILGLDEDRRFGREELPEGFLVLEEEEGRVFDEDFGGGEALVRLLEEEAAALVLMPRSFPP